MHVYLPCLVVSLTITGLPNYEERISTLYTILHTYNTPPENTQSFSNVDTLMCDICATRKYTCIYNLHVHLCAHHFPMVQQNATKCCTMGPSCTTVGSLLAKCKKNIPEVYLGAQKYY